MKARNSPDVRAAMARLAAKLAALPPKPKPKAKPKAKAAPAAKPTNVVALVASRPALKIAPTALGRAGRRRSRLTDGSTRPADSRPNPFALPVFPKGVGPAGGMAMDEVPALAWAATQAIYSGAFWEGQAFFGYTLLAELAQRPEYRRISERIATEATRKWIKLQVTTSGPPSKDGKGPMPSDAVDPDKVVKIKKIEDAMKRLKVQDRFRELAEQDGFFGRSHLYLDTGDGASPDELRTSIGDGRGELSKSKVNTSKPLIGIRTVEASWCSPSSYDSSDPLSPRWYKPESWYVMAREVHGTRLLTFVGREVPDLLKPAYAFGGLALTQMAKPYVDNWLRTRQSVSDLIASFSTMVLMTDLQSTLTGDGGGLYDRLDLFNLLRDNHGVMALNKDSEDFKNVTTPLGTLDMLQAQSQEQMSSVCGIPIVILLGIQPMGLNASSEGEIRVFYDLIAAYQNSFFADKLTRVIDFIQLSEFSEVDPEITFRFEPLWSLDEKAKAEVRKIEAETDKVLIDAGVLHPEESRERVAADPESPFASIDVEDVPEPPPDPMEAGGINPGGDLGGAGPGGGGQPQPKEAGAQDATVLPFGVDDLLALDAFSEADHPRGQPGNAGQFGPGGSGGGQLHAPQYGLQHGKLTASHGSSSTSAKRSNIGEPLDPSTLTKVSGAMGSNPGGVYEDDAGKKFYVKKGKSKDHVRNEMTAAKLYDLAGTPTLNYRPTPDGTHVATEMAKLDKDNASKLSDAEKAEAARDFAVHAWLGNWDAVGLGGDNLGTVKGKPTALDLGGALEYRAQGAPKGKAFGEKVGELDTLRDAKTNKDAAGVFGEMTPADMRESARYVTTIPDSQIKAAVKEMGGDPALAAKLIARKNDIAKRMKTFGAEGNPTKSTSTVVFPAGEKLPVDGLGGVAFKAWKPPEDWSAVDGQAEIEEPEFVASKGKKTSSGVVIKEADGRVWLIQPKNAYGGYEGGLPKGGLEEGLSMQANAIKEAWEETGLKVKIVGHAGDRDSDFSTTRYYLAEREGGDPSAHDGKETEGVVLVPMEKAAGFLNRKAGRDLLAGDAWNESDHPRGQPGNAGQFGPGGGSPENDDPAPEDDDPDHGEKDVGPLVETGKPKKTAFGGLWKGTGEVTMGQLATNIDHVLAKPTNAGTSYRQMLAFMLKKSEDFKFTDAVPKLKTKLGEAFKLAGDKAAKLAGENAANPDGMKYAKIAKKAFGEAEKLGYNVIGAQAKPAPEAKSTPAPKVEIQKSKATLADLEKAKKSVALAVQYVPGFNELQFTPSKEQVNDLVNDFNKKWSGKEGLPQDQLEQKVHDFKLIAAKVQAIKAIESTHAAELATKEKAAQQKNAAAQAAANKAATDKLKEAQAAAKAKNKEYMAALGISETEASGFDALVDMMGESSSAQDLVQKFKSYQKQAESLGYPISGFQYALIRNYIDGGYKAINKALRSNSPSVAQHVYARLVNNAIDKLPKFTGTVVRGTTLSAQDLAVYKPGHVVQEHGFTSTGIGYKFGGNVSYKIKANGMRGGDFSQGANTGEAEVLFKAKTQFLVHKVEKKGETTYIEMEEVEGHG